MHRDHSRSNGLSWQSKRFISRPIVVSTLLDFVVDDTTESSLLWSGRKLSVPPAMGVFGVSDEAPVWSVAEERRPSKLYDA